MKSLTTLQASHFPLFRVGRKTRLPHCAPGLIMLLGMLVAALIVAGCREHTPSSGQDKLPEIFSWLPGYWEMSNAEGRLTEYWKSVDSSCLAGESYFIRGKDSVLIEKLQLICNDSGIFYQPLVTNQNQGIVVLFRLISSDHGTFIFENPLHDFPQRIIYSHPHPDSLVAVIEGIDKGSPRREVFRMNAAKN